MVFYIYLILFFCLGFTYRSHKPSRYELTVTDGNIQSLCKKCNKDDRFAIIGAILSLAICAGLIALMVLCGDGDNDIFFFKPYLCGIITASSVIYCIIQLVTTRGYKQRNEDQLKAYLKKRKQLEEESQRRKQQEQDELVSQYGRIGEAFHFGSTSMYDGFYCFPDTRIFYHKKRAIPYDHVIDVQISCDQRIITDGSFSATTSVDGAGIAIGNDPMVGAMSASAETSGKSHQTSRIDSTYTVTLYLRDEQDKYFDIACGKNEQKKAHSIMLTVREIIESNRQHS